MIIGISGKIGSGKDLAGQMIEYIGEVGKWHSFGNFEQIMNGGEFPAPTNWQCKKFADALKDNVCRILGCTREQLEDRDFKEAPLGKEWELIRTTSSYGAPDEIRVPDGNKFAHDIKETLTPRKILQLLGTEGGRMVIHPNIWVNAAMAGYNEDCLWYFTDMRFPNELNAVVSRGGVTIRLERGDGNTGDHPSEVSLDNYLDKFDYVIDNNGEIEDLYDQIVKIMHDFNLIK